MTQTENSISPDALDRATKDQLQTERLWCTCGLVCDTCRPELFR